MKDKECLLEAKECEKEAREWIRKEKGHEAKEKLQGRSTRRSELKSECERGSRVKDV